MRRPLIWMQAALCAATFSMASPVVVLAGHDQPPPHAEAHGKQKAKKAKASKHVKDAKDHDRTWDRRFRGLDRNRNNVVSRAEWDGDSRSFANHDWNHDGLLSGDELIAGATRTAVRRAPRPRTESDEVLFARRDINRDGHVSRSEWIGTAQEFNRLDKDRDGVLSPYEYGVGR